MSRELRAVVIGAGNVAWHLAPALSASGIEVSQVVSRTYSSARSVASRIGPSCRAAALEEGVMPDADLYILAVSDDAIASAALSMPDNGSLWCHTSGSVGLEALGSKRRAGVLYPLQTFSKNTPVDMNQVPLFLETSNPGDMPLLREVAQGVSPHVSEADSRLRRSLHVAAVFACNFANAMWAEADALLKAEGLDIKALLPLIEASVDKLRTTSPAEAQTGPARRGDRRVIATHEAMLSPRQAAIYHLLSQCILSRYHEQD